MLPNVIAWQFPETPILIAITIAVGLLVRIVINRAIRIATERAIARAERRRTTGSTRADRILAEATGLTIERQAQRAATLGSLLRSLTSLVVAALILLTVLSILEVPLGPILASAGIGGVAIGFGAQSLVKDYLSGMFLISEDQFGVGDSIDVGTVTGTVEDVGLRVTRLRDLSGKVWYVRNGEILRVGNVSQGWATALVNVPIAFDEDIARALTVLRDVAKEFDADPRWNEVLLESPIVAGVDIAQAGTITLLTILKTPANKHWDVQRAFLERALTAFAEAGIRGPLLAPPPHQG